MESTGCRNDNSSFPVRISGRPEQTAEGEHIILIIEDITDERARHSEAHAIAEERRRIARDIHDGLAQNLAALRMKARLWHDVLDQDPARMHAELDEMRAFLSENIRDVRRSIFALRPVALDELGFVPAVQQLAADCAEQYQLDVDLNVTGQMGELPAPLEPVLFRIIQESLNNAGRHAQADTVWIDLDHDRGTCAHAEGP